MRNAGRDARPQGDRTCVGLSKALSGGGPELRCSPRRCSRWRSPAGPARRPPGPATDGGVPAGNVAEQAAAPTAGIPLPGGFTLTGLGAVASDYLFRGISQTRNNWAFQGTFDLEHESGVYVGAFLTNAKFLANPWNDTRQELDLLAGYRFAVAGVKFDVGYIAYLYPGQDKAPGGQLNEYQEVGLKASYTIDPVKLQAAFFYSPNFFGRSGDGYYVEGGVDVTLPLGFTAIGRLGYQWIERNAFFGTPDYLWYAVGVQREIFAGINPRRRPLRNGHQQARLRAGGGPRQWRPAHLRTAGAVHGQPSLLTRRAGAGQRTGANTAQQPPGRIASSSIRPFTLNSPNSIFSSSATPFSK